MTREQVEAWEAWVSDLDKREREYVGRKKSMKIIPVTKQDEKIIESVLPKMPAGVRFCRYCGKQMPLQSPQSCIVANGYCVADDVEPKPSTTAPCCVQCGQTMSLTAIRPCLMGPGYCKLYK